MGLLAFCGLAVAVGLICWKAITSRTERKKLKIEFSKSPTYSTFLIIWVIAIFVFVIGIFVPSFGELEFFETGLQIWQVGGLVSLALFIIQEFDNKK